MKIKILFIFFLIQILYCDDDITIYYDPLKQYENKTFSPSSNDICSLIFLDLSKFKKGDNIFYYFKFNQNDAYEKRGEDKFTDFIYFFAAFINKIETNVKRIYSNILKENSEYEKKPKSIKRDEGKAIYYFSVKKKDDYKYLIIALYTSKNIFYYDYTFKNTEKDESKLTIIDIIIIIVIIMVIIIIIAVIIIICVKNKKCNNVYDNTQQGQTVQIYSQ